MQLSALQIMVKIIEWHIQLSGHPKINDVLYFYVIKIGLVTGHVN